MRSAPARVAAAVGPRGWLTLIVVGAVVWSVVSLDTSAGIVHAGGGAALARFFGALLAPDLSPSFLATVAVATVRTGAYAVAGMSIALLIGIPGGLLASGLIPRSRWIRRASGLAGRAGLAVLRAVHELVWAVLFVAAVGLSPVAGVLAIGIPYGGIIGRILAERLQDVPDEQLAALRASGASETQVLLYGRVPAVSADLVSYLLYRLECAVRAAAILSFVGLGGIGFRIAIALDDLRFDQVWTLLFALLLIIFGIDAWSAAIRRRLVA